MSAPDPLQQLYLKGRLVLSPTNLSLAYPYGGTGLGLMARARAVLGIRWKALTKEEFGNTHAESVMQGESLALLGILRSFDSDVIAKVWPNTSVGAKTGENFVNATVADPTGLIPSIGSFASDNSAKIVFAPDDEERHPWILIYNAIPLIDTAAEIELSMARQVGMALAYLAVPDASYKTFQYGKRGDLTL